MPICWIEVSVQCGRSCDLKALLVFRRREADTEMVRKIPSGCCVLLMQPSRCQFITGSAVALNQKKIELNIQMTHFDLQDINYIC